MQICFGRLYIRKIENRVQRCQVLGKISILFCLPHLTGIAQAFLVTVYLPAAGGVIAVTEARKDMQGQEVRRHLPTLKKPRVPRAGQNKPQE